MTEKAWVKWVAGMGMLLTAVVVLAYAGASGSASAARLAAVSVNKWNAIAMALDSTATISSAQTLAAAVTGAQQVLRWNAGIQNFEYFVAGSGAGTNFSTSVGESYFLLLDSSASTSLSLVGPVPPATGNPGAVQFSIVGGSPCKWNHISLPLDHSNLASAQELANDIEDVEQVLRWNATIQNFEYYVVSSGSGSNFATSIGRPYWVCAAQSKNWP